MTGRAVVLSVLLVGWILPGISYSQNSLFSLGLWNLSALSGEAKVGGLYGYGTTNSYGINNTATTSSLYGGLSLKTSSYIWNPNFLAIDLDGGYYPESHQDVYLVFQNRFDNINTRKLHVGATLFPRKPITLGTYYNLNNSYDSRENLADLRTNSKNYGATLTLANKYLPLNFAYDHSTWDTKVIGTNQSYNYLQQNFEGRTSRSFGLRDKNDLIYTHHDYTRNEYDISYPIRNISDNISLLNSFIFDSAKKSHFSSNISATDQRGNDSLKQFRATENLYYLLPQNLVFNATYGYYYITNSLDNLGLNTFTCMLSHQLFESLHTDLLYEYTNADDSYHEINNKAGITFTYTKKTFWDGMLVMGYNYSWMHEQHTSKDVALNVINEEYTLSDATRTLLKNPYVDSLTVVVKDVNGFIFQPGIDYVLTTLGIYMEIQRIPGGKIPDNSNVYVFYSANQPGSYSYNVNQNNFSFNYSLFKRLFSVYYKSNKTDYTDVKMAEYLLLDYLTDKLYGARFEYKFVNGGVEYEDFGSTIAPYKMTRYYLTVQGNVGRRLVYSLIANWRDYKIPTETPDRVYQDVTAMASYSITSRTKLDCNVGYQYQNGRQINLDLAMARCRLSTIYHTFTFSCGLDYYDRIYLITQKSNYIGGNIQISKKFKY